MFYVVEYLLVQFSQLLSGDFQDHEMEGAGIFWKSSELADPPLEGLALTFPTHPI